MSSWPLIIFVIGLSITLGEFPSKFLKCSFHFCILGWQLLVLLSKYSSFCSLYLLSAMLFVIAYLLSSFWFYWFDLECILVLFGMCLFSLSFFYVSAHGHLLSYFYQYAIFMLSRFFLTISDSHGTLHLALSLVGMHSVAISTWVVTKFSYTSNGICLWYFLRIIEFVSYSYRIFIANISFGKWRLYLFQFKMGISVQNGNSSVQNGNSSVQNGKIIISININL